MSAPVIPLQSSFLYQNGWNEEMDELLIDRLIEQKSKGNWSPKLEGNFHALLMAKGDVNESAWWPRTWEDMVARQTLLKKRYDKFFRLVQDYKVLWDKEQNKVVAEESTWDRFIKRDPFAAAYYYRGEPQWSKLKRLFDNKDHNSEAKDHEIVIISDSTTHTVVVSDDSEEVVSPIPANIRPTACKRLFDDSHVDEHVASPPKPNRFPPVNAFQPKPANLLGPSKIPSGESSCASSSPVKWFSFQKGHW